MAFNTTTHDTYQYPFPKPIVGRPCEPPSPDTQPLKQEAPVAPYCHCDAHAYDPKIEQYKQLLDKEQKLCSEYELLKRQMVDVTNDILDHPCDDLDTKMRTMYQSSFVKRSFPVSDYQTLMAAAQSSAPIPRESNRLGRLRCYYDPTEFVSIKPVIRPTIHPPGDPHTAVMPQPLQTWFTEYPNRTEYMDKFSASGKALINSMQRFREPMPSTRRRADDRCV